ncbi:ROK family transcriptional regulator [Salinispira pacifica]
MQHRVSVRQANQKQVLNFLRTAGDVSIADVAGKVRLSKPTIKKVIDLYESQGMVFAVGKGDSTEEGGKRPTIFRFNRNRGCALALHLGPDFVFGALTDLNGDILHSLYYNFSFRDLHRVMERVCSTIRELYERVNRRETDVVGIGIGLPGIVDVERGLSIFSPHFVEWGTQVPFREMLRDCLQLDLPILIDNVNRLQAFAEYVKGQGVGCRNFVIVDAICEGLGAGILVDGGMYEGAESLSGEIGHMVLQPDGGPDCICGGKGCFEALVSTKRIRQTLAANRGLRSESLVYSGPATDDVNLDSLFRAYREGDPFAEEIIEDIIKWFAIGLNNVIMVYDPEKIILQGIYSEAGPRFLEMLRAKINQMSLPYIDRSAEIVFSALGRERGVLGAANFVLSRFFESDLFA